MYREQQVLLCCKELAQIITDQESGVEYESVIRLFTMGFCLVFCCPFCGQPMPRDLRGFLNFVLKEEFEIDPNEFTEKLEQELLPKEFSSSDWWANRSNYKRFPRKYQNSLFFLAESIFEKNWLTQEEKRLELKQLLAQEVEEEKLLEHWCCTRFKRLTKADIDCPHFKHFPHYKICNDYPVVYESEKRRFKLININNKTLLHRGLEKSNQTFRKLNFFIKFCPECGSRLPKSLAKEWFEIVREKFGITDLSDYKAISKLPEKYLTEEWWREAGL